MKASASITSRPYKHSFTAKATGAGFALASFLSGGCAQMPSRPTAAIPAALDLSAARPLIDATVAGMPVKLRVDPGQWDTVELNAAVAAHLEAIRWTADRTLQIGRIALSGRTAEASLVIGGQTQPILISEHGRSAVEDADGVIGLDLLPFASISWRDPQAPPATATLVLPVTKVDRIGLVATIADPAGPLRIRFALLRPTSEATAAAGSMLAQRYGGHFDGPERALPILFGVSRPARPMRFARPMRIVGFRFDPLWVRTSDFRGDNPLPADPVGKDEIVVAGKDHPQPAESWVTLARDTLSRCREIRYDAAMRTIALSCAFDP